MDEYLPAVGGREVTALAPCFVCKQPFLFDPDTVISVLIDPECGLPPDLGGDPGRAKREPVCPRCLAAVAAQRQARGLPPHFVGDPGSGKAADGG